jgi:hypothetical protein
MFKSDSEQLIFDEDALQDLNLYLSVPVIKGELIILGQSGLIDYKQYIDTVAIRMTPTGFREIHLLKAGYPEAALLQCIQEIYKYQVVNPNGSFTFTLPDDPETYFMCFRPYFQLEERKLAVISQYEDILSVSLTNEGLKIAKSHDLLLSEASPIASHLTFNQCQIGVAAGNASHFTVNVGMTIDELSKLIEHKLAQTDSDLAEAKEMINALKANADVLPKGKLNRFAQLLAKHEWLSGAVAQTLLQLAVQSH